MRPLRQCGAAVVMAMLTVAIAATLVAGMFWRQEVLLRQVENELAFAQAQWLLRGVTDWARVILAEDARTSRLDHGAEPWALQIADTRLDADGSDPAYLAGGMHDAQAKYNLRNLVGREGIIASELETLRRLLDYAGVSRELAVPIAQRVLRSVPGATSAAQGAQPVSVPLRTPEDLLSLPGFGAEQLRALHPYLTVLPNATPVNANTAPAEVLAARIEGLSLPEAQRLVASRERAYFRDLQDIMSRVPDRTLRTTPTEVGTSTQFFLMEGRITYRRARLHAQVLLMRTGERVTQVWTRELS